MDISSIFPSSDNLYKFLFMGGIFMIVFAIAYPFEKEQKIEIDINTQKKEIALLNRELKNLDKEVKYLEALRDSIKNEIKVNSPLPPATKAKISIFSSKYDSLDNIKSRMECKKIELDSETNRVGLLQKHVNSFSGFKWALIIIGTLFALFGIFKWYRIANYSETLQKLEVEDKRNNLKKK